MAHVNGRLRPDDPPAHSKLHLTLGTWLDEDDQPWVVEITMDPQIMSGLVNAAGHREDRTLRIALGTPHFQIALSP